MAIDPRTGEEVDPYTQALQNAGPFSRRYVGQGEAAGVITPAKDVVYGGVTNAEPPISRVGMIPTGIDTEAPSPPKPQPAVIRNYGENDRGYGPSGGTTKVDYTGRDLAAPQGLPPGVTTLPSPVAQEGPIAQLGIDPSLSMARAEARKNAGPNSFLNPTGEGPVVKVMGNGITMQDENRLTHNRQKAEQAVLKGLLPASVLNEIPTVQEANARASKAPLSVDTEAGKNALLNANVIQKLAEPGLEQQRVNVAGQEVANRLTAAQGDIALRKQLGLLASTAEEKKLAQEARKIDILGQQASIDILGKKLALDGQQRLADFGQRLMNAKTPEEATQLQQSILALTGHDPRAGAQVHVIPGEKTHDQMGNVIAESPGAVAFYVPGQGLQIIRMPAAPPAQTAAKDMIKGQTYYDANGKPFRWDGTKAVSL
jgi:hypothetical protein